MLFRAKNGRLPLKGAHMDYVRFGTGCRNLVLLPGLGDGLQTVKGTALPMAWMYRSLSRHFTVWMFSRPEPLAQSCTTRDMARDINTAMDALGIGKADVVGVSMGGMIAQYLALDYPDRVTRLVLTVTCGQRNPILESSVREWISQAEGGDHTALMASNLRLIYSHDYCRKNMWMVPLLGLLTKPKSYSRFLTQANACLTHNPQPRLSSLTCPTLVVGGEKDLALGAQASRELAAAIPGAKLHMYENWGHGLYEEAPDFWKIVSDFLLTESD